jgi:hypothetical protein
VDEDELLEDEEPFILDQLRVVPVVDIDRVTVAPAIEGRITVSSGGLIQTVQEPA